jgi:tRNA 2-thiouridine synthesizing protein A
VHEPVVADVRGLKCSLPVLKPARRMRPHRAGVRFVLLATDPMAAIDVPHFCQAEGRRLHASVRAGQELRFELEKA